MGYLAERINYVKGLMEGMKFDVTTDEGEKLGIVKDVLQTGANDVYVIQRDNKKDVLIPVIPSCVLDIDTDEKKVLVHLMPGLID